MLSKETIAAYDRVREKALQVVRSACYAPYVSLYLMTTGDVIACCKNQSYILGNVSRYRLLEIWRGPRVKALRRVLKEYNFDAGCGQCEWQIQGGNYLGAYTRTFDGLEVQLEDPEWPIIMEFALSNACNFECVMCFGELSSLIRKNRDGLPPLSRVYDDRFFDDLREFLPHLRLAKFFGGEPFLAPENFRIWDMMIEQGLQTPCHIVTNGSVYNERVQRVLDRLPVSLSISLDGATKETFESIRINGKFEEVMANTHRLREYGRQRGSFFSLVFCLMRQNWHEFPDLVRLAEGLGVEIGINTVADPPHCSLFTLPPEEMLRIADELERMGGSLHGIRPSNRRAYDNEVENLRNNANARQVDKLQVAKEDALRTIAKHEVTTWNLVHAGKLREALREVDQIPETHLRYWHAVVLRGHILHLMGDLQGAERELDRALKMSSRRPEVYMERAWLRLTQERFDEGLQDAERAKALVSPGDALEGEVLPVLGMLQIKKQNWDEAKRAFDRLLELRPNDPRARVRRGWGYHAAGLPRQALAESEAALALAPGDAEALKLRDLCHQQLGASTAG